MHCLSEHDFGGESILYSRALDGAFRSEPNVFGGEEGATAWTVVRAGDAGAGAGAPGAASPYQWVSAMFSSWPSTPGRMSTVEEAARIAVGCSGYQRGGRLNASCTGCGAPNRARCHFTLANRY